MEVDRVRAELTRHAEVEAVRDQSVHGDPSVAPRVSVVVDVYWNGVSTAAFVEREHMLAPLTVSARWPLLVPPADRAWTLEAVNAVNETGVVRAHLMKAGAVVLSTPVTRDLWSAIGLVLLCGERLRARYEGRRAALATTATGTARRAPRR